MHLTQIAIELTEEELSSYLNIRQTLVQKPKAIIEDFSTSWLRVVGKIGPCDWLLADDVYLSSKLNRVRIGVRDASNLKLAHDYEGSWHEIPFDPGYWVLDKGLADRVIAAGIKGYGITFLYDFDISQINYKLQELLLGQVVHW